MLEPIPKALFITMVAKVQLLEIVTFLPLLFLPAQAIRPPLLPPRDTNEVSTSPVSYVSSAPLVNIWGECNSGRPLSGIPSSKRRG